MVRTGFDFVMLPHEKLTSSFDSCTTAKIALEIELTENPVVWGDFTSFTVTCKYKDENTP